jgi:membrane-associated phospholipid phosphatase
LLPFRACHYGLHMRVSEAIAVAYFTYLAITALVIPLPTLSTRRRLQVWLAAGLVIGIEIVLAAVPAASGINTIRDWLPALAILFAYFATGLFFVAPSARAEAWLRRWDDRLIGARRFERMPRPVRVYFDAVYDACFLIIPAGFAVLVWAGQSAHADRYWTLVSAAEFLAFGTLPWFQARPPWAIETPRVIDQAAFRRFSLSWVNYTTIHANTFPSAHASASLAVALAVWPEVPWAGALLALLAVSIAVASVVGRFHYAIDAITGLLLALALWAFVAAIGL